MTLSQSGETADTLAALRYAKQLGYIGTLAVCNVPGSSLVRESDITLMTRAGPEIGVASTKAFTTQLIGLMLLTLAISRVQGGHHQHAEIVAALEALPSPLPAGAGTSIRRSKYCRRRLPKNSMRCSWGVVLTFRSPLKGRSSSRKSPISMRKPIPPVS
ncbi:SIS domain-containing protein [Halomonas sp. CUBES01]|uniref:SIS domain-containing protein n=1 Tax=Halomonas sp. CUBES01 TaxID=2897340 RepID=UPI003FA3ABE7